MSSSYPDSGSAAVLPWFWQRARGAPPTRWQAMLQALAVAALVAYGMSVIVMLQERWLVANMGEAMRFDAIVNLAAAAVIAAGLLARTHVLVLAGGAFVLWAALQQGSAVGWLPSMLLPWAVSLVTGALLVAAAGLGRAAFALTAIGLFAFGYALASTRALAIFDFAVAGFVTLLVWALLDLAWRATRGTPLP